MGHPSPRSAATCSSGGDNARTRCLLGCNHHGQAPHGESDPDFSATTTFPTAIPVTVVPHTVERPAGRLGSDGSPPAPHRQQVNAGLGSLVQAERPPSRLMNRHLARNGHETPRQAETTEEAQVAGLAFTVQQVPRIELARNGLCGRIQPGRAAFSVLLAVGQVSPGAPACGSICGRTGPGRGHHPAPRPAFRPFSVT